MGVTWEGRIKDIVLLSFQSYIFMTTVVDGVLLPKAPEEILAEKKFNKVPYIVGFNKQEFGWNLPSVSSCRPLERTEPPTYHSSTPSPNTLKSREAVPF